MTEQATLTLNHRLHRRKPCGLDSTIRPPTLMFSIFGMTAGIYLRLSQAAINIGLWGSLLKAQGLCKWLISGGMIAFAPEIIQAQSY